MTLRYCCDLARSYRPPDGPTDSTARAIAACSTPLTGHSGSPGHAPCWCAAGWWGAQPRNSLSDAATLPVLSEGQFSLARLEEMGVVVHGSQDRPGNCSAARALAGGCMCCSGAVAYLCHVRELVGGHGPRQGARALVDYVCAQHQSARLCTICCQANNFSGAPTLPR